ncbi:ExbD/TolR family protein [Arenimonas caeni]|jgi:biopolymer transport protein ExbD|uniref:Biopolymer transporter ExbD n=1 Tax=Arenimonas caeni TaxID=2058085 RepID=A0A2P6M7K1_9GAMM|nr:biopolymer transporter ExbD [Arenimonas caeni]MDY0021181.1 biopolymer transporter ExbD [Arenimonas caeni]PRH81955.1 biopolymer transporter ExbD [Arenimonas caeni]
MAFSNNSGGGGPMADINVTPLVDVMLVLLIIFMITAPLMSHKVKVELPQATLETKPKIDQPPVTLAVTADGQVYWNDEAVTRDILDARLAVLAQKQPQPQVDIRSDNFTKYSVIHEVVQDVRQAGIRKVGFVSTPER